MWKTVIKNEKVCPFLQNLMVSLRRCIRYSRFEWRYFSSEQFCSHETNVEVPLWWKLRF